MGKCRFLHFNPDRGNFTPPSAMHRRQDSGGGNGKEPDRTVWLCTSALELLRIHSQDLAAVVVAASLAGSVRHDGLTALGASRDAGGGQLPVGATALIAAGLGYFTLGDSHGDTSLVKLLLTAFIMDLLPSGSNPFETLYSRSCFKAANRGSSSFWQPQGPSLRFLPQR